MPTTYAIPNGSTAFAATLYTGNGTSQSVSNALNGTSFQPDFVWLKCRSNARDNVLFDSVRGIYQKLYSNLTVAESTDTGSLTAFNSNGFTLGGDSAVNTSTNTFVGWQWKAGGAAVTNTAGSITSQVSANTAAGFSVVTYTGTGSVATIGHGLGVKPSLIFFKVRSNGTYGWYVYNSVLNATNHLVLNTTAAVSSSSGLFNDTEPTSTVMTVGTSVGTNQSGQTFVAYCWAAVPGYSAFGSYTGNGSTDGTFVYTGFRPRFVLFRSTSARNWVIRDTSRNTYNAVTNDLYPDSSAAEYAPGDAIDFLSNGFKLRATGATFNGNGEVYIYMAFAETPFAYSNAR